MAGISLRDAEQARLEIAREQAAEVQKLYRGVYRDLRKQLKGMTSGGATTSLRKSQLKQLTKSLKEAYNTLGPQLEGSITSSIAQASQAVIQANNDWMASAGLSVKGAYAYVPQDIVTMLASGKLYSDGWTLSKAIWGESQQKAHEIDLIVAKGVAANKSAYDIAKDLEKYVNPGAVKPWDWSKVYPGTSKKVDYNAQRLARTMVSHAYQQSLERVCSKNPFVVGYRWVDAHTDRTCQLCRDRATADHYGMGPGVYPKGELPMDHPNGMCTFTTVMSNDLTGISNRLADWANGGKDPALDKWYNDMGGKPAGEPVSKQEKQKAVGRTEDVHDPEWIRSNFRNVRTQVSKTFGKDEWARMEEYLRGLSEEQLRWLAQGDTFLREILDGSGRWQNYSGTLSVVLRDDARDRNGRGAYASFFHEFGHLLDSKLGSISGSQSKGLPIYKALEQGYNRLTNNGKRVPSKVVQAMRADSRSGGVQDIISGLSQDRLRIRWGHSREYWERKGPKDMWKEVSSEAWAHMNSAYILGGESERFMREYFPEAYDLFLKEVQERIV